MSRRTFERGISYDSDRRTYYLCMELERGENGHRQRKYRSFPSLREARKARDSYLAERAKATIPRSPLTLNEWLDQWLEEVIIPNRAETTIYGYRKMIENHVVPALGHIPLQDLSPGDLQHYYAYAMREKGLGANSVRRHHDLLSAALHAAVRQNLLLRSPTDQVEPPRAVHTETKFYTSEHLKNLYRLIEGNRIETAVHLAGSLGLRREEICGLRWSCVDFELRRIHIRMARTAAGAKIVEKDTKNRSSTRVLYMGDDICTLLRQEQAYQNQRKQTLGKRWVDSGFVAVDAYGAPIAPNCLSMRFTRFIRAHPELPPLTLHGLRHSFATVASAQGVPLFDIGKALGHSTPAITGKIYTHLIDQLHAETLERVAQALR